MAIHRNVSLLNAFSLLTEFKPFAPISIIYFAEVAGSFSLGMLVFSIASIATSLLEVPTGILSDRWGRKEAVMLGALCNIIGLVMYAIAPNFYVLAFGSLFVGAARSCFSGNNEALLFDSLKETGADTSFPTHLGRMNAMLQSGLAISAILGGLLATRSMSLAVWASIPAQMLSLMVASSLQNLSSSGRRESSWSVLKKAIEGFRRNRRLKIMSISSSLHYAVDESLYLFSPAFISSVWPVWGNGVARLLVHLFGTGSFLVAGRVVEKTAPLAAFVSTHLLSRFIGIVAVVIPTVVSPLLLCSTSLFFGICVTAQQTILHREFTDAQRATMGSLNSFFGSLAFALVAYLMGLLADISSSSTALLVGELILLGAISLTLGLREQPKY